MYTFQISHKKQFFVPRGFAHGFIVLSNTAIFSYKCDNFYNGEHEAGIIFSDPTLNIDWGLKDEDYIVSEKDEENPMLANADFDFPFDEFSKEKLYA